MMEGVLRLAIVDTHCPIGTGTRLAEARVDFIQLRDKTADGDCLAACAKRLLAELQGSSTRLLVNSRADVAMAAGAHGVHLTSFPGTLAPSQVRGLYQSAGLAVPFVSVSCHTLADVERARDGGADMILFGPVFEKRVRGTKTSAGIGLDALRDACAAAGTLRVLALGGITNENAGACMEAGAAGVAAIRLFS
jgi:thiamine-phosphate pyrophosphorylase